MSQATGIRFSHRDLTLIPDTGTGRDIPGFDPDPGYRDGTLQLLVTEVHMQRALLH